MPGTDPVLKDEIVLLGAHFDSVAAGTGATDNATGSAAMMEALRILKTVGAKPRRTIRIALWGGEEQGLLGSRAYVREHFGDPATMALKPEHAKLSAYFNSDNGTGRVRGIWLQGNPAVEPIFRQWMEPLEDLGVFAIGPRSVTSTDHVVVRRRRPARVPVHGRSARVQLAHASLEHGHVRSRAARRHDPAGDGHRRVRLQRGDARREAAAEVGTAPVMKTLLKVMIALVAVAVLAVLFVRSARSTRAQPFTIARQHLAGWTLTLAPDADPLGSSLSITPKAELMPPLARDLFARMGESLHYPPPAMPVVLRSEFQRAIAGVLTPEALLDAAREAGLESATFQPRCMARRRISAPGVVRGVYFLLFDLPQFTQFREQVAQRLRAAGRDASLFDPAALSPVADCGRSRWKLQRLAAAARGSGRRLLCTGCRGVTPSSRRTRPKARGSFSPRRSSD